MLSDLDAINRLASIGNAPAGGLNDSYAYDYNSANQRIKTTLADGSYWLLASRPLRRVAPEIGTRASRVAVTYDSLGQVISGKRYWSDATPVAGQQQEYTFDDIGNRTSAKSGGNSQRDNPSPRA